MKTKWFQLAIAGSAGLLQTERTLAESVVYDNSATYLGTAREAHLEDGNEITLSGTQRVVTSVAIAVEIAGSAPATVQALLSLYANDSGYPGTLLWQSDVILQQIEPGGPRFIDFAVPGVTVPNTFIWALQFVTAGTQVYFSQFHPPIVGSVRYGYWRRNAGPAQWGFMDAVPPFGAVVTAQPDIPAMSPWGALFMILVFVVAGAVIVTRARRRLSPACAIGANLPLAMPFFFVCVSGAAAQVQVGPQFRIDNGGTAAANETSIASSNFNRNEIVAAWNDWRDSPPNHQIIVRVGVAVSNDGGATWSDSLIRPHEEAYRSDSEGDPMTAYDDRTGTLWVGGISFASDAWRIFVARKIAGQAAF